MPLNPTRSDRSLLEDTEAGDADAFGVFFVRHSHMLLRFIRRRVGSPELAADLTAETFAAALIATHAGRAREVPDGGAWLRAIARHKLIDTYRKAQTEDAARRLLGLERIGLSAADREMIETLGGIDAPLHAALDSLSAAERQAVIERVVLDRDYATIARDANDTEAAVRKRVSRGLSRLRKEMGV
jgi:RNA polymerase sigma-70 factor, ECF subfamily